MEVFMQMCYYFLWFAAYSIAGWIYEMILFRFVEHKWVRRGFLYGPFCPIYGTGADLFWLSLRWIPMVIRPLIPNVFWSIVLECVLLFFIGGLMACTLEYLTSMVLEHVFHTRWWDYFKNWGNIKGRVAPIGFAAFGGFAAGLVEFLHPAVKFVTESIPDVIIIILAITVGAWMMADFILTLIKLIRKKLQGKRVETGSPPA